MYICEDNAEKEKIEAIVAENERKSIELTKEKLNNLNGKASTFSPSEVENDKETKNQLIKSERVSFIQKIINAIRNIFKK